MMKRLLLLVSILILSLFGILNAQTINPGYIDGHLYFKFNDDYNFKIKVNENTSIDFNQMPAEFTEMFERYGVTLITRPLYAFNDPKLERIIRLEFTDAQNIALFIKELELLEDVEYAEMVPYCTRKVTYNDPYYTSTTLSGIQYNFKWHLEMINAPQAWGIQQGSANIKVAIVDNAVWGNHPDLQIASSNQCSFANGTESVGNSAPPSSVSQSTQCSQADLYTNNNCPAYDWSHGTHCAGLVGAINNNNTGISSIGGGVTLLGVRTANNEDEMYYCMNGVRWAVQQGAKVVSMSYGSTQQSTSERTAFQTFYNNGVILVAAAGNEGDSDNSINYPAGYSTVISVASVNNNGKLSSFSQYGNGRADVAAPGGFVMYQNQEYMPNILSTTYCTSQMLRIFGLNLVNGQYYDGMQGTSMATPITAGLCGLMASAYPNITPAQAKECLISTGTTLASGSNTIDNNVYINAYAAVQCAQSYSNSLVVTPTSLTLPSAGGSETVSVRAGTASSSWTASSNQSWLSISPATGSGSGATTTMTVTANSANETGSPRTATVTISHGSSTATVTVTQSDDSDQCVIYNEDILEDDSTATSGIGSNLYFSSYYKVIAEKVNVTGNYTLDKITFADMLNTATSGSIAIKVLSANNGAPSTTELYSANVTVSTINNALTQGQLQGGGTCYYGEYEHTLNSPINVTGPFFISVDFTNVGEGNSNTMSNVVCIADNQNNGLDNTAYINSIYSGFSGWKLISNFFSGIDEAKFAIQAHICPSSTPSYNLSVSPSSLSYIADGESKTVTVTSNTSWTATSSADWLTLSPTSGSNNGTITAVAAANTSSSQRTATITVSGTGVSAQTISVTQAAAGECVLYNENILADDSTRTTGIGSNLYFSEYYKVIAEKVNVTGNYTLDKITFADMLNTATSGSIAIKVLSANNGAPSTTELYSTNVTISTINNALTQGQLQGGGTCYYGEYEHTLSSPIDVTGPFFISVDFTNVGVGDSQTMSNIVCIADNQNNGLDNTAYINSIYSGYTGWKLISNFFSDIDEAKFAIQAHICPSSTPSYNLSVSPSSLSYAAAGESKTVTVTSNTSWTATSSASWLTINPASGSNNGTITAVAAANTSTSQRTATITVSGTGVSSQTISVTQAGVSYNLTVNPSSLSYAAAGESKTVTVTSNTSWTATSSESWLTVSPASGSNNGTITAVAAANTTTSQRTATITVSGGGITRTISVTQAAASVDYNLTVNPSSLSYVAEGESKTVTVTSNTSWTATSSESWLTISPASGSNNGTITAVAAANTSTQQRTATITVSGSGITRTVSVTQAGAPTAIDEEVAEGISVYPNPTSGMFTVGLGAIEGKAICQIVNANGSIIETREVNADSNSEIVFDCNVNSGVYFVRIISGNNVWTKRVVIEK